MAIKDSGVYLYLAGGGFLLGLAYNTTTLTRAWLV